MANEFEFLELTVNGQTIRFREQLQEKMALLEKKRRVVAAEVETARKEGDLSENTPYTYGLQRLEQIDAEMAVPAQQLRYKFVDPRALAKDTVATFGSYVFLTPLDPQATESRLYRLVGPLSSEPEIGWINAMGPVGQNLFNAQLFSHLSLKRKFADDDVPDEWEITSIFPWDTGIFDDHFNELRARLEPAKAAPEAAPAAPKPPKARKPRAPRAPKTPK